MGEPEAGLLAEYLALNGRLREVVRSLDAAALDRAPVPGENTIAVLVAHTIGSEMWWLGFAAGRALERDRDAEFRTRGRTPDELVGVIDAADAELGGLLAQIVTGGLGAVRTMTDGSRWTAARAIARSLAHTGEHAGHAELTRNLLVAPTGQ